MRGVLSGMFSVGFVQICGCMVTSLLILRDIVLQVDNCIE